MDKPPLEQKIQHKPELPSAQDPQLPEIISATSAEDESKIKPQIITAAEEEPPEQITASTANTESQIKKQKIDQSGPSKTRPKRNPQRSIPAMVFSKSAVNLSTKAVPRP